MERKMKKFPGFFAHYYNRSNQALGEGEGKCRRKSLEKKVGVSNKLFQLISHHPPRLGVKGNIAKAMSEKRRRKVCKKNPSNLR